MCPAPAAGPHEQQGIARAPLGCSSSASRQAERDRNAVTLDRAAKRKTKAAAVAKPTALLWTGDELVAKASAGDGWEYYLASFGTLGSGGLAAAILSISCRSERQRNYKISKLKDQRGVDAGDGPKAVAEQHFAKRQ